MGEVVELKRGRWWRCEFAGCGSTAAELDQEEGFRFSRSEDVNRLRGRNRS